MANSFLDPVLGWLLYLDPALAILLISLIISLIITLALKFLTDQSLMKDLKQEMKELQKEMKELRDKPDKLAKINTRFMETNTKYMTHSMKPTLYTFLPIIIIFGWLNSHMGYLPIQPDTSFEISFLVKEDIEMYSLYLIEPQGLDVVDGPMLSDNKATWVMRGAEGEYDVTIQYKGMNYTKDVIVAEERVYAPVEKSLKNRFLFFSSYDDNNAEKIIVGNEKILPFKDVPIIKDIPWVSTWSWFGVYFLFSIMFSTLFRRLLKIY